MAIEMPPELLEAMHDLDEKHWDDIIEMWRKSEAESKQYEELYYKQVDNLNQGNRTFQERKRLLTPAEQREELFQGVFQEVQKRKEVDLEKQQPHKEEVTTQSRLEDFTELKNSLFKYTSIEDPVDPPGGKGNKERDKDDPNDPDKDK